MQLEKACSFVVSCQIFPGVIRASDKTKKGGAKLPCLKIATAKDDVLPSSSEALVIIAKIEICCNIEC